MTGLTTVYVLAVAAWWTATLTVIAATMHRAGRCVRTTLTGTHPTWDPYDTWLAIAVATYAAAWTIAAPHHGDTITTITTLTTSTFAAPRTRLHKVTARWSQ